MLVACALSGALSFLLGLYLGRKAHPESCGASRWTEPEDGVQGVDPWTAALADPDFVEGLRRGEEDIAAGRVHSWRYFAAGLCGALLSDGTYCPETSGHLDHWPERSA